MMAVFVRLFHPYFSFLITPHVQNATMHHMTTKRQNAAFIESIAQLQVWRVVLI
jgi:hypothetical protein